MAGYATKEEMQAVIERFIGKVTQDPEIARRCKGIHCSIGYDITDLGFSFFTDFNDGVVTAGLGETTQAGGVILESDSETFDGMMTGELDAASAAMSGQISFSGDVTSAMGLQALQDDMTRLYQEAKAEAIKA